MELFALKQVSWIEKSECLISPLRYFVNEHVFHICWYFYALAVSNLIFCSRKLVEKEQEMSVSLYLDKKRVSFDGKIRLEFPYSRCYVDKNRVIFLKEDWKQENMQMVREFSAGKESTSVEVLENFRKFSEPLMISRWNFRIFFEVASVEVLIQPGNPRCQLLLKRSSCQLFQTYFQIFYLIHYAIPCKELRKSYHIWKFHFTHEDQSGYLAARSLLRCVPKTLGRR